MSRPVVNPGRLIWSGEHWINYLRLPGATNNNAMVSLYYTRYSAAGEGSVALVDIAGEDGLCGVCTDAPALADFILENMIRGSGNPFDRELPLYPARIERGGDIRWAPNWTIEAEGHNIVSTWSSLQPPVIAEGPAPVFSEGRDFFTLLVFTDVASIAMDGRSVPGKPYLHEGWKKSIGGARSSCVFALSETMIETYRDGQ
ncbi:MAG: hypothetical protein CME16_01315 [Gemmatimonadetes bacterium]|nr:hypothetical protein [Gemmatimonadota bacterium]